MSSESKRSRGEPPAEALQQCLVRDANERTELANTALAPGAERRSLRCECGDLACDLRIVPSHPVYEAVRSHGSQFLIGTNHENPESSWVLCERVGYAIIDVVERVARYIVMARNMRHTFVDAIPVDSTHPPRERRGST